MKIGIIGAMEKEIEALRADMTEKTTCVISGMRFDEGKLCGRIVVGRLHRGRADNKRDAAVSNGRGAHAGSGLRGIHAMFRRHRFSSLKFPGQLPPRFVQQIARCFDFDAVLGERFVRHDQPRYQRVLLNGSSDRLQSLLLAAHVDGPVLDDPHDGRAKVDAKLTVSGHGLGFGSHGLTSLWTGGRIHSVAISPM